MKYVFKVAGGDAEFEQIRRLNHRVFAEEVRQHNTHPEGLLEDPYESRSRFLVALAEDLVVGMVSVHDTRPFSVEKRLADPSLIDELSQPVLEVRLLAIDAEHRNSLALLGLLAWTLEYAQDSGYRTLVISGVTSRLAMYTKLGFEPMGDAVPDGDAAFVPMALELARLPRHIRIGYSRYLRRTSD